MVDNVSWPFPIAIVALLVFSPSQQHAPLIMTLWSSVQRRGTFWSFWFNDYSCRLFENELLCLHYVDTKAHIKIQEHITTIQAESNSPSDAGIAGLLSTWQLWNDVAKAVWGCKVWASLLGAHRSPESVTPFWLQLCQNPLSGTKLLSESSSDAATVENLIWETQTLLRVSLLQMMDEQEFSDAKNSHI